MGMLIVFPMSIDLFYFIGSGQDREQRTHKPESRRTGWLRSAVQDQETHAAHQTDESLLRETGAVSAT